MFFPTTSPFVRIAALGGLVTFPLLLASNAPSFWCVAPLSVAAWTLLALTPASKSRPALWTLFFALWAFYGIGQRFFITWGVAAWLLVTLYQALLTFLPALALRAWFAKTRLSLPLLVTVTWITGEFLRAQGPFGLPSGSLALPLSETPLLMQTADLGGIYAVSVPLVATGGLLAQWLHNRRNPPPDSRRTLLASAMGVALLWCFAIGYGAFRLAEGQRTISPVARVAVVQTDGPTDLRVRLVPPQQLSTEVMAQTNALLAIERKRGEPPPALIVWPESPGFPPLTRDFLSAAPSAAQLATWGMTPEDFSDYRALVPVFARSVRGFGGASLLYGCAPPEPDAAVPGGWRQYNAATLWLPNGTPYAVRQNKVHLAPFGEYLPGLPPGEIPPAVHRFLPAVQNLSAGADRVLFDLPGVFKNNGSPVRFAVVICNEIALPTTAGVLNSDPATVSGADFVAVMANEGSFGRGELAQHSRRVAAYRAIEARVGIARTANTGISGFYKPDGTFYGAVRNPAGQVWTGRGFPERPLLAEVNRLWQGANNTPDAATQNKIAALQARIAALRETAGVRGSSVQSVYTDTRAGTTLYARYGDWFGGTLLAICIIGSLLPKSKDAC